MDHSNWRSYSGNHLGEGFVDELERQIKEELAEGYELKICIGTDSQFYSDRTDFACVVVLLRIKHGGRIFLNKFKERRRLSLQERLLLEVTHSIDIASRLLPLIERYKLGLEVHADINSDPRFKSEGVLAAAKGYILGMGFEFKAKPFAFASSSCADKIVS